MDQRRNQANNHQRGVLIIWLALFLLVLIGFVSIGVDLAKLATTQAQLQTAADAAALAGASAANSVSGKLIEDVATTRALLAAEQNKAYRLVPESVAASDVEVSFPNDTTIHVVTKRVQGDGSGGMITHFAAAFLGPAMHTLDMKASADAQVIHPKSLCGPLFPMGAVQPPSGDFQVGCAYSYDLKVANGTEGNYGLIDYPPCDKGPCAGMSGTGKATLNCLAANGYWCCLSELDSVRSEPGNATGPVRDGMQTRWSNDSDQRTGICYDQYNGNGSRVVTVPITDPFPGGRSWVHVRGFASFFLLAPPGGGQNGAIRAEFIKKVNPGTESGGNGTVLAVRLVK